MSPLCLKTLRLRRARMFRLSTSSPLSAPASHPTHTQWERDYGGSDSDQSESVYLNAAENGRSFPCDWISSSSSPSSVFRCFQSIKPLVYSRNLFRVQKSLVSSNDSVDDFLKFVVTTHPGFLGVANLDLLIVDRTENVWVLVDCSFQQLVFNLTDALDSIVIRRSETIWPLFALKTSTLCLYAHERAFRWDRFAGW